MSVFILLEVDLDNDARSNDEKVIVYGVYSSLDAAKEAGLKSAEWAEVENLVWLAMDDTEWHALVYGDDWLYIQEFEVE